MFIADVDRTAIYNVHNISDVYIEDEIIVSMVMVTGERIHLTPAGDPMVIKQFFDDFITYINALKFDNETYVVYTDMIFDLAKEKVERIQEEKTTHDK